MTTTINIDSLKSSLLEKKEAYNALTLALEKKETESKILPSSIDSKNSVCLDLVGIISEETSEYNKLISLINEKKTERDFLYQQMADQDSVTPPHSIQTLISKLDNEILANKIYCDALNQSITVQTATHDALMESVNIESTDFKKLDPEISSLKDKTQFLSLELATATTEYESLSAEKTASEKDENTTVTLAPDPNNFSIDPIQQVNEQNNSELKTISTTSEDANHGDGLIQDKQIITYDDVQNDIVNHEDTTAEISTDLEENQGTFTIGNDPDSFSIETTEQQLNEQESVLTSSEIDSLKDDFKLDQVDFEHNLDQNDAVSHEELITDTSIDQNTATFDTDVENFSIEPSDHENYQESELNTALASAELDALEDEFNFDLYPAVDERQNRRKTTRYVRTDIKTKLIIYKFFGASRPVDVELLDVSSKGAMIKTSTRLSKNAKISLKFNFQLDARHFVIPGRIMRKAPDGCYGIKFNKYQNEFADHLLSTQTSLLFK